MNAELKTTFLTHTFAALKKIFTPVIASFLAKRNINILGVTPFPPKQ